MPLIGEGPGQTAVNVRDLTRKDKNRPLPYETRLLQFLASAGGAGRP